MKQIILDTNFLLIPFTQNVDILSEINRLILEPYVICVLDGTIEELEKIIREQKGKDKNAAKLGLVLVEKKGISIINTKQKSLKMNMNSKITVVDDVLVSISDNNTIVGTQDKILRQKLHEKGVKTIYLRSRKKLEIY